MAATASLNIGGKEISMNSTGSISISQETSPMRIHYGNPKLTPSQYTLAQNYPNPFNPKTRIEYTLPANGHVTINIYNTLGEEVASLVDGMQDAGFKSVEWDAAGIPSGMYFYKITAGLFSDVKKMLLVK
jgi:hypothetical protein